MENYDEFEKENPEFDQFVEYLMSNLPEVTIINLEVYSVLLEAANRLEVLAKHEYLEGTVSVELFPEFLSGAVSFEGPIFCVDSLANLIPILFLSNNIDICSLTNGNIKIDFTFQNVFKRLK